MGYDTWLEKPYQEAAEKSDRFEKWCEDNDVHPDDSDAQSLFDEAEEESEASAEEVRAEYRMELRSQWDS